MDRQRQDHQNELEKSLQDYQHEVEKERLIFSNLHERRADAIDGVYQGMNKFDTDMRSLVKPHQMKDEPSMDEKLDIAGESCEGFRQYFRNEKIYFPEHISDSIEELLSESRRVYRKFRLLRIHDQQNARVDDDLDQWMGAWEKLTEEEIPELRRESETHFRDLIGVETEVREDARKDEATDGRWVDAERN